MSPFSRSSCVGSVTAIAVWIITYGVACRSSGKDSPPVSSGSDATLQQAVDASLPHLVPEREAFWARYIGDPGIPGPQMLAFCRDVKGKRLVDVAPETTLERQGTSCQLFVQNREMVDELTVVLRRWMQFDTATFLDAQAKYEPSSPLDITLLDTQHQLSTSLSVSRDRIVVRWRPYVPLEKIIGSDGQLLVGFDVKRALGKSPLALRGAISPPFEIAVGCSAVACDAEGPSPPGGGPIQIGVLKRTLPAIQVKISTTTDLVPRIHTLLDATLGPGRQEGPSTHRVHRRDGVRYSVTDWSRGTVIVDISPDTSDGRR